MLESNGGETPRVLDLFAGGGAVPLEAARLGCEATAVELNPVAHLIELCMLDYPQRFGPSLADDVRRYGERWVDRAWERVGHLYPPALATLWGELAFQLGGWKAYERVLVHGDEGVPPGGELLGELLAGAPTLVLLDEVLIYVVKARALRREDTTAGQQAMVFLQNLTEAVNQQSRVAMVYSLQASVGEAVQEEGLLQALEHISARLDSRREPVSGDEVLRVVQASRRAVPASRQLPPWL